MTEQQTTLSRMVREANEAGRSFEALAAGALDPETGRGASKGWLVKLAHGRVMQMPEPRLLRAVAATLRLPLAVVQDAAAREWMEYKATEVDDDDTAVIVAHLGTLTAADRRRIRRLVETWGEDD